MNYTHSLPPPSELFQYQVWFLPWSKKKQNQNKIAKLTRPQLPSSINIVVLWNMQFLSEIILLLHYVGKTLMRDVEKIDKGLNISSIKQISTYTFPVIIFKLVRRSYYSTYNRIYFRLLSYFVEILFLPSKFFQKIRWSRALTRLLDRFDFAFFFPVLNEILVTPWSYPFIMIIKFKTDNNLYPSQTIEKYHKQLK